VPAWPELRPPHAGCLLQLAGSSEPSTQSLSRSHTQTRGMQRLVIAHWNWLGAQVTSAAGGTSRVRRGRGGGQGSASHRPAKTTLQSREACRRSGHHGKSLAMLGDHMRERGGEQSPVVAPEDLTSCRETGQKPQDPSAVQQAQCKSTANIKLATLKDFRISLALGNRSVCRGSGVTVGRGLARGRGKEKAPCPWAGPPRSQPAEEPIPKDTDLTRH